MSKILITGGAGYIGSILTQELLAAGHSVRVLDCLLHSGEGLLGVWTHPHFEFLRGDVTNAANRKAALKDVESVVHLAAIVGDPACKKQPDLARAVNEEASCRLIDEAGKSAKNFVFVSTCSNYGISDPAQLASEESPLNPVSLYAETKVAVERYLLRSPAHGITSSVLRLATVYGVSPRMRFDLTVNEFARDAALNKKLVVYGELHWRPYVHVHDVVRAIVRLLETPEAVRRGQVFNVGRTQENYQKLTLCQLLQKRFPALPVEYVKTGPDPRSYRVSFEKISKILGYETLHDVTGGLNEVIALVQKGTLINLDDPRWRNS